MVFSALCLISVPVDFVESKEPLFISVSAEGRKVMFLPVSVCLSVCPLDYSKIYEWIWFRVTIQMDAIPMDAIPTTNPNPNPMLSCL